jgi:hypothetical protein
MRINAEIGIQFIHKCQNRREYQNGPDQIRFIGAKSDFSEQKTHRNRSQNEKDHFVGQFCMAFRFIDVCNNTTTQGGVHQSYNQYDCTKE